MSQGADGGRVERLFVAILLPEEAARELRAAVALSLGGEEAAGRGFRLPRADGLHVTLHFLGDVPVGRRPELEEGLAAALVGCEAPRLRLGGAGAFPRRGNERVLWVGVGEEERTGGRLQALHDRARAAWETDERRPFRPHLTVARPRAVRPGAPGGPGAVPEAFFALEWRLDLEPEACHLVRSERGAGPALYRPIARFPLDRG